MRALLCSKWGTFDDVRIESVEAPALRPGTVRIKAEYASLSYAINLMVAGKYQHKDTLPFIPGKEVAGTVIEVAPDVGGIALGDRVVGIVDNGAYAEEVVVSRQTLYKVPDDVDLKAAIHIPVSYGTAYTGLLWRGRARPGETILVHGAAGGLGYAATQLARRFGLTVIASASTEERRAFAIKGGAHHAVPSSGFRDTVKELTGGKGVDIVFDPVGGDVFDESLRAVAQDGRLIVAGFADGRVPQIPANILLVKSLTVLGHYFGRYVGGGLSDERRSYGLDLRKAMETMFSWVSAGELQPSVSAAFPLEQYREAMRFLTSRTANGKVVLQLSRSNPATEDVCPGKQL